MTARRIDNVRLVEHRRSDTRQQLNSAMPVSRNVLREPVVVDDHQSAPSLRGGFIQQARCSGSRRDSFRASTYAYHGELSSAGARQVSACDDGSTVRRAPGAQRGRALNVACCAPGPPVMPVARPPLDRSKRTGIPFVAQARQIGRRAFLAPGAVLPRARPPATSAAPVAKSLPTPCRLRNRALRVSPPATACRTAAAPRFDICSRRAPRPPARGTPTRRHFRRTGIRLRFAHLTSVHKRRRGTGLPATGVAPLRGAAGASGWPSRRSAVDSRFSSRKSGRGHQAALFQPAQPMAGGCSSTAGRQVVHIVVSMRNSIKRAG